MVCITCPTSNDQEPTTLEKLILHRQTRIATRAQTRSLST
jgi:hypothetical protein